MGKEEWYRRTSWSKQDQEAFFARNRRSRGNESKAGYMHVQALTLLQTGRTDLAQAALALLQRSLTDYPLVTGLAGTLETAGQCCEVLGRTDEAVEYYRRAIKRETEFTGLRSNARFKLAKLAVESGRTDIYAEALEAMEAESPSPFPWHAYILNGMRAIVAHHMGDKHQASSLARAALKAATIRDTGLSHGRGHLGTVTNTSTTFHTLLERLADA